MISLTDIKYFKMAVGSGRIKQETANDITARCPICGDSKYSKNKARLHLYSNNSITLVNCFNECSVRNMTMYRFLKNFYPSLFNSYKMEVANTQLSNFKKTFNNDITELNLLGNFDTDNFKTENDLPKPIVTFNLAKYFTRSEKIEDYIENRGLEHSQAFGDFYLGKSITIDDKNYPLDNFIVIPLYCDNKWYGFYSRSLKEHKFYTYMPDKNQGFKLWNYYNLNKNEPVYVFEGIFDAMSAHKCGLTNVCACMGATPPLELLKDFKLVFCLDNDRTGFTNTIKYAKLGYEVVVYPSDLIYKDCNEMLLNNINVKDVIINNITKGLLAEIKLRKRL